MVDYEAHGKDAAAKDGLDVVPIRIKNEGGVVTLLT
jgi:hypothetical protein